MVASHPQRRLWIILGIAVLGLTTTATTVTFFLPLVVAKVAPSNLAVGFAVGVEGFAALTVPLLVGQASDGTWTKYGRRLPYMLAATPLVLLGLVAIALLQAYWLIVAAVVLFFIGYYAYYTAYQSLYPDTLDSHEYGRAWAYQSIFQGTGVALALLGGGALLNAGLGAPFLASGVVFLIITLVSLRLIKERRNGRPRQKLQIRTVLPIFYQRLQADRNLRLFLATHFLWEYTLAAIRAFVILYLLNGLNLSKTELLPVLVVVILSYLIASLVSGHIVDRFDPRQYTAGVVVLYAAGMIVAGTITDHAILSFLLPFGMFAGAAVLMLSYPIMLRVTPADRRGEYTGYYQFNRGLALLVGTSLTGWLIDRFGHFFPATDGFQILWISTGIAAALSLIPFLALTAASRQRA